VPLRAGAATGAISGELFWRGSDGGAPVGAFVALGVLVLLGGAAVVVVRRRRRSAAAGDAPPREEAW
jgi:LPXTG-motif cell wall-anchored protein